MSPFGIHASLRRFPPRPVRTRSHPGGWRTRLGNRGYWCLPEADINLPFTPGMAALIQSRLAPQTAHETMITARRYGGADAATAGIVDPRLCPCGMVG